MTAMKTSRDTGMLGLIPKWVHVVVLAGSVVAFAATTKADVAHLTDRVASLEQNGSPPDGKDLAAISASQRQMRDELAEMNKRLNSIDESLRRSR